MTESIDLENPANLGVEVYSLTVRVQDIACPNYSSKYPFYISFDIFLCCNSMERRMPYVFWIYAWENFAAILNYDLIFCYISRYHLHLHQDKASEWIFSSLQ